MRVLTAQATKRVMQQLQESDLIIAQWLNHFCAEHPPLDGNKVRVRRCLLCTRCLQGGMRRGPSLAVGCKAVGTPGAWDQEPHLPPKCSLHGRSCDVGGSHQRQQHPCITLPSYTMHLRLQFLLSLLSMKGTTVDEPAHGLTHQINPQQIAHRILMVSDRRGRGAQRLFDGLHPLSSPPCPSRGQASVHDLLPHSFAAHARSTHTHIHTLPSHLSCRPGRTWPPTWHRAWPSTPCRRTAWSCVGTWKARPTRAGATTPRTRAAAVTIAPGPDALLPGHGAGRVDPGIAPGLLTAWSVPVAPRIESWRARRPPGLCVARAQPVSRSLPACLPLAPGGP